MPYSNEEGADVVLALGAARSNKKKAVKIFQMWHPGRRPSPATIVRQYETLKEFGKFSRKRRRPSTPSGDVRTNILAFFEAHPLASIHEASSQSRVPLSTVWRVAQEACLHPSPFQLHQQLQQGDFESRLHYANWLLRTVHQNPQFLSNVMWTEEVNTSRDAQVDLHNAHYWSTTNPRRLRKSHHQYKWSLKVWCCTCDGTLIAPVFLHGTLTADRYLNEVLQGPVEQFYANLPLARYGQLWFQHDGAPAQSSSRVRVYLDHAFPNQWVGRFGPVPWPARSPDLTPLDFFLWEYVKDRMYVEDTTTPDALKAKITQVCHGIPEDMLRRETENTIRRCRFCVMTHGELFEHLH
uniref:Putative transposable element n=1 Tax=Ornithodoros turicata TaxID=34597 RepID=A0A2R5L931_9ACAR